MRKKITFLEVFLASIFLFFIIFKIKPVQVAPKKTEVKEQTKPASLESVKLMVVLVKEDSSSSDGNTKIESNSIIPYFYLPKGVYTVQKRVSETWENVATNINFNGEGSMSVEIIAPNEDNISYRVQRIENEEIKEISKIFTVKRSDIKDGQRIYE